MPKETIAQRLARLKGDGAAKTEEVIKPRHQGGAYVKKGGNGGARPGAGGKKPTSEATMVKKGYKAIVDRHVGEDVKIQITDPKTGRTVIVKKPRLLRVLEVLYEVGVQDRNAEALNKWLDRALGRAVQPVEGGDPERPILLKIDF